MSTLKYPIAIIDLDGTLLTQNKIVSKKNQEAIHAFRQAGGKVILASGRNPYSVACHAQMLGLAGHHIGFDGNAVIHISDNGTPPEVEYIRTLDSDFPTLFETISNLEHVQCGFAREATFFFHEGPLLPLPFMEHIPPSLEGKELTPPTNWIDDFPFFVDSKQTWLENLYQSPSHRAIVFSNESLVEVARLLQKGRFNANIAADGKALEVSPHSINKGNTLVLLADRLGFALEDTIAFGDGHNDAALLGAAGRGIAMDNAFEEIKKIAYAVTKSNVDDGVAHGLKKWAYC